MAILEIQYRTLRTIICLRAATAIIDSLIYIFIAFVVFPVLSCVRKFTPQRWSGQQCEHGAAPAGRLAINFIAERALD
jgi:hypothetical protein